MSRYTNHQKLSVVEEEVVDIVNPSAPPIALTGIIVSMMLMAGASGISFAYLPIKIKQLGFEPWVASAMIPSMSLGGLLGCLITGWLLRLSGHARMFMTFYAGIILSFLIILVSEDPLLWGVGRFIYGIGINSVFIIALSWMNDVCSNDIRGRVITIFYVCFVVMLGVGAFMIGYIDINSNQPMVLAAALVVFAIFPVGLTRLRQPIPPEEVSIKLKKVWKISPVGLFGMFCVGGLTLTLQGMTPIYAGDLGFEPSQIGLLMLMLQMGLIVVQLPMGALSDKIDRRYVLIIVATMSMVMAITTILTQSNLNFLWMVVIFAIWAGSIETIYSVSSALANDRAEPKEYVFMSSTQMVAYSIGAFIIPLMNTVLLQFLPVSMFMWVVLFLSTIFAIFVVSRMFAREAVDSEDMESFQYTTAQVVDPGEYYNPEAIEDAMENAGISEGLVS